MENEKKTARPFGLNFVEALSDEALLQVSGDKAKAVTLALSIRILPNGNELHYDSY